MADIRADPTVEIFFVYRYSSESFGFALRQICLTSMMFETKDFTTAGSALISAIEIAKAEKFRV